MSQSRRRPAAAWLWLALVAALPVQPAPTVPAAAGLKLDKIAPPGAKQYRYEAVTRRTAARQGKVRAGNLTWTCKGRRCTITGPWPRPGVGACQALARQVGEISAYGHPKKKLGPAELARCNQAAARPKPKPAPALVQDIKLPPGKPAPKGKPGKSVPATAATKLDPAWVNRLAGSGKDGKDGKAAQDGTTKKPASPGRKGGSLLEQDSLLARALPAAADPKAGKGAPSKYAVPATALKPQTLPGPAKVSPAPKPATQGTAGAKPAAFGSRARQLALATQKDAQAAKPAPSKPAKDGKREATPAPKKAETAPPARKKADQAAAPRLARLLERRITTALAPGPADLQRLAKSLRAPRKYRYARLTAGADPARAQGSRDLKGAMVLRDPAGLKKIADGLYQDRAGGLYEYGRLGKGGGRFVLTRLPTGHRVLAVDLDGDEVVDLALSRGLDRLGELGAVFNELGERWLRCKVPGRKAGTRPAGIEGGQLPGRGGANCEDLPDVSPGGGGGHGFNDYLRQITEPECSGARKVGRGLITDPSGSGTPRGGSSNGGSPDDTPWGHDRRVFNMNAQQLKNVAKKYENVANRLTRAAVQARRDGDNPRAGRLGRLAAQARHTANAFRQAGRDQGRVEVAREMARKKPTDGRIRLLLDAQSMRTGSVMRAHRAAQKFQRSLRQFVAWDRNRPGGGGSPLRGADGLGLADTADRRCAGVTRDAAWGTLFANPQFCKDGDFLTCMVKQQDSVFAATGGQCRRVTGPDDRETVRCEGNEEGRGAGGGDVAGGDKWGGGGVTDRPGQVSAPRGSIGARAVDVTPLGGIIAGLCQGGGCPEDF